jgi:hypothetical protein
MVRHQSQQLSRARRRAAAILLPVLALALWAAPAATPARAQPAPMEVVFEYTGAAQTWTVPAGVTEATFDLYGAEGGGRLAVPARQGGLGGWAGATLPVQPGSTITILVGGMGGSASCRFVASPGAAGGFNGGGAGGDSRCPGSGGGGATDVRIGGADLAQRVLVAGGGGGAAQFRDEDCGSHDGGAGGGLSGEAGPCGGGMSGGQRRMSGSCRLGQGSTGTNAESFDDVGGGGGGGGYCGGGGGPLYGGGGGGSGFGPEGAYFQDGVHSGHGLVFITYTVTPGVGAGAGSAGTAFESGTHGGAARLSSPEARPIARPQVATAEHRLVRR